MCALPEATRPLVTVLIPALAAERVVSRAVRSALVQPASPIDVLIVADDDVDYLEVLRAEGVNDARVAQVRTGGTATGCAHARNVGLAAARGRFVAMLDADDVMHPNKLAIMLPLAEAHGAAACALEYCEYDGTIRTVLDRLGADTPSGLLGPRDYLRAHPTANAMLVFDRTRVHHGWREDLPALEDIVFAMETFSQLPYIAHVSQPLHDYVRTAGSMSVGVGGADRMIAAKEALLQMLARGDLQIPDRTLREDLRDFITVSLEAERAYAAALSRSDSVSFHQVLTAHLRASLR